MKKDEAAALGILALLGIGVAVFAFGGDAKAGEPPPPEPDEDEEEEEDPPPFDPKGPFKPTPNEPVPSVEVELVLPTKIPLSTLFVGGGICQVDNEPYNTLNWPSPSAVAFALTALGFPVSSDIGDFEDIATVKDFQVTARSLFLKGMQNAPANMIDGVVGPCTLRALTEASRRFNAGNW